MKKRKGLSDSVVYQFDNVLLNIDDELTLTQVIARDYPNLCIVTEDAEFEVIEPKQLPSSDDT